MNTAITKSRIESIDVVRGLAMIIMALDHVRDFFHVTAFTDDPLNLATTSPLLYFTRWITHFCAPIFVFLSGTSIYLQSMRKTKKELSAFLIKRGLWLIAVELVIISFSWTFDPFYHFIPLQVIWAIGISMVIMGFLIHLPYKLILAIGFIIVFGHNLLDIPEAAPGFKAGFWWDLLHHGNWSFYAFAPNHFVVVIYPFIAWTGIMLLGYTAGIFFTSNFSPEQRQKNILRLGMALVVLFIVLRFMNVYGDPFPWKMEKNGLYTFLSFMKIHKYPPSLLYLCITLGPALILLSLIEKVKNRFTRITVVFGRTAFFYYIIHFFFIHILLGITFYAQGHTTQQAMESMKTLPFMFAIPGQGFGLAVVYGIWAFVIVALFPLCKWYDKYKTSHKEKWWLSYL
jgi:uncharacterized membrane protein